MTNGDGSSRFTRRRTKGNGRAEEEVRRYYDEGMKEYAPRRKKPIAPTSQAAAGMRDREQRAKTMLSGLQSGEIPSVEGNQDVMDVIHHLASQSVSREGSPASEEGAPQAKQHRLDTDEQREGSREVSKGQDRPPSHHSSEANSDRAYSPKIFTPKDREILLNKISQLSPYHDTTKYFEN